MQIVIASEDLRIKASEASVASKQEIGTFTKFFRYCDAALPLWVDYSYELTNLVATFSQIDSYYSCCSSS